MEMSLEDAIVEVEENEDETFIILSNDDGGKSVDRFSLFDEPELKRKSSFLEGSSNSKWNCGGTNMSNSNSANHIKFHGGEKNYQHKLRSNNNANKNNNKNSASNNSDKGSNNNNWSIYNRLLNLGSWRSTLMMLFRLHAFRRRRPQLLESWVLFLHYRLACCFFLVGALNILFQWYSEEEIVCVNSFNGNKTVEYFILNICLSYSSYTMPDGTKRFLLFYRWVPYAFLLVAHAFYLPRFFMKRCGDPRAKWLFAHLAEGGDPSMTHTIVCNYYLRNMGIHRLTYAAFVAMHVLSAFISPISFYFLDFLLQGQFQSLVWETFPFSRDAVTFMDPLSLAFPPFVTCIIDSSYVKMMSGRADTFNCHFTHMEMLEKLFIIAWVILVALCVVATAAVFVLLLLPLVPAFRELLLRTALPNPALRRTKRLLVSRLDFGDIFLLWLIKEYMTEAQFCSILNVLGEFVHKKKLHSFHGGEYSL